jgi:predicted CDP-diglyceride synthetase/phosphatidate cytidylyltransferase
VLGRHKIMPKVSPNKTWEGFISGWILTGAGRVLPKGTHVPIPLTCCVLVGEAVHWTGDQAAFMSELKEQLDGLKAAAPPLRWRETTHD